MAIKKGITVLNSPGTIDADYRGEICVILVNLSSDDFVIEDGERICQMVIARHEQAVWEEVEVLDQNIFLGIWRLSFLIPPFMMSSMYKVSLSSSSISKYI